MILNKISFLSYGTPFVYIYFILKLPIGLNRKFVTFLGFILGLAIDIFCNTPGVNAAATTLIAFFRRPVQDLFFVVDEFDGQVPKLSDQKGQLMKYAILLTIIHHTALLCLESFSFFNWEKIIYKISLSVLLTVILIFAFEGFSLTTKRREEYH